MKLENINKIIVIGAGTMGSGIAQLSAMAGYQTVLFDVSPAALPKAMQHIEKNLTGAIKRGKIAPEDKSQILNRLTTSTFFSDIVGDLIIEAIVEDLRIKLEVFKQVAQQNAPESILATNTSSIPISRLAAQIPHPERVVGMHFFNPAHIMKLVEVISGVATAPQVATTVKQIAQKMGKKAVTVNDSPGFIVNRVARHFYVEGLKIAEERVADIAVIDELVEASGFKMGPFRLMDLIGVDTNFAVTNSMFESFNYTPKFRPNLLQAQKVAAGYHGKKTGKGFYNYT